MNRPSSRKSVVWNYFKIAGDKKIVVCNICFKQYKYFGNTTNSKEHLKRIHPLALAKEELDVPQRSNLSCAGPSMSGPDASTAGPGPSRFDSIPSTSRESGFQQEILPKSTQTTSTTPSTEPPTTKRKKQLKLFGCTETKKVTEEFVQEIDRSVVKLITTAYQPMSIVEDKGFKKLLSKLNPNYTLPSRKTSY